MNENDSVCLAQVLPKNGANDPVVLNIPEKSLEIADLTEERHDRVVWAQNWEQGTAEL